MLCSKLHCQEGLNFALASDTARRALATLRCLEVRGSVQGRHSSRTAPCKVVGS
jgi:hypothetical protein